MKFEIYSVKDIAGGQFSDLKCFINEPVAIRWFNGLCTESKIASDLQLYKLGNYNVESGQIEPCCEFVKGGVDSE